MSTIPEYTLAHSKVIAKLTTGRWEVSYPGYPSRTEVREGATAKSYGLRWDTGCDLRVQGKAFTEHNGVIDGYDKADGRHFVRYTPVPSLDATVIITDALGAEYTVEEHNAIVDGES